jgi:hypothetical protein
MLIGMMIAAMLMTALAAAFDASMLNFKINEDAFKVTNTARQALVRITTELRTANAVAVSEPASECSIITAGNSNVTYKFDSTDNTLYLITNDDDYILATGVTAMTFTKGLDPTDPGVVRNVQISMTVSANNFTKTISTAAVLRRNIP